VIHLPVYEFEGYTFRPATPNDLPLAQQWNRMDPDHKWELQYPDYWIEQNIQVNSYVLEDSIGVLFFVKSIRHMGHEVEISLQFDRQGGMVSKARATIGMAVGFAWLKKALPMNGFKALYFVSKADDLILFTEKRLGFVRDGIRMIYKLEEESDGG
jgi:hypothetical protein